MSIPVAKPVNIIQTYSIYNKQHNITSQEPITLPLQEQVVCRDCNQLFYRNRTDIGTSSYYRCLICQKNLLGKSLCASCILQ